MITLTLNELLNSQQALANLGLMKLPARVSFRVAGVLRANRAKMEDFDKTRLELFEKYGKKDNGPEGEILKVPQEQMAAFNKEAAELTATNITLECEAILLAEFGDAEISPTDALALGWLVTV
jgi:hypothetical protein